MEKNLRIRFQGNEYLLIGSLEKGGPIATKEQYKNFEVSYAQLKADGSIWRFRDSIGHRDEIEVLGDDYTTADSGKAVDALMTILDGGLGAWMAKRSDR